MSFPIVGRRFTPDEFEAYLHNLDLSPFKPSMVVLHNTSAPSLAQRPNGLTAQHIENLHGYYQAKGWNGGPHLFIDQNGIWVFNPLNRRGTHAPSWNGVSWGVEMVGEFENESFDNVDGGKVHKNAVAALTSMFRKLGLKPTDADAFHFHKEDPHTTHKSCPGQNVRKDVVIQQVMNGLGQPSVKRGKLVVYKTGQGQEPFAIIDLELRDDGKSYASAELMSRYLNLGPGTPGLMVAIGDLMRPTYRLTFNPETIRVYAVEL